MISFDTMMDEDFQRHAFAILRRELGLDGFVRFFRLNRVGYGDYTKERRRWLDSITIPEIMAEVEQSSEPKT